MVGLVSEELKTELCKYLGELTYLYENTYDWIEKDKIGNKINAVNELLDINDVKESWFKLVAKEVSKELKFK